jgi:hypothetical protein
MAILGYNNRTLIIRQFGLDGWLKTRGLAGWLEIATDRLDTPAKQRIAREIEIHYADAVNDHMAAGEPEVSAKMTALKELGDPQVAAANFQKSHLTVFEAKSMGRMERTAAKPFFSGWAVLFDGMPIAGTPFLFSYAHQNTLRLDFHFLAGLLLLSYTGFRLIPRLLFVRTPQSPALLRELALCNFLTQAVVVPFFWLVPFPLTQNHDGFQIFDTIFVFYVYGYALNPGLRIWKKLRKMDVKRNELPPWPTPAS